MIRLDFSSPQSLSEWLALRLSPDSFTSWGIKPGTKNVHNLWLEIFEGESLLTDSALPVRTVQVATIRIIGKDERFLIESHQEMSDGTIRKRNRPLSEKIRACEDPESAAKRAVMEELGSILTPLMEGEGNRLFMEIVPGSYVKKVEEGPSLSYPGLPTRYVLHSVDAFVEGLPDVDFSTEEHGEYNSHMDTRATKEAISVVKHYWKWVAPGPL